MALVDTRESCRAGSSWFAARAVIWCASWPVGEHPSSARSASSYPPPPVPGGVVARIEQGICTRPDLQDVGSQLWNALRPPGIQEAFAELERQADESRPLQVWLDIPPEPEIEQLPWEALHDETGEQLPGHRPALLLCTHAPRGCPPCQRLPRGDQPIRVLVVIPEGSGLQVQYEWNNLRSAARDLRDVLYLGLVEGRVTPDHLLAELRSTPYDVLHYIGHGEASEEGISIRLNGEEPGTDLWMDASTFASLVQGQHLRLALLNCCLGASPSLSRTLSGLGPTSCARRACPPSSPCATRFPTPSPSASRTASTASSSPAARPGAWTWPCSRPGAPCASTRAGTPSAASSRPCST